MSEFLSYPGRLCGHDLAVECSSIAEFEASVFAHDGSCETGAVLGWRLWREKYPGLKLVTVHRPVPEIMDSFRQFGLSPNYEEMLQREAMLEGLASQEGVLAVSFEQLRYRETVARIFEHCLELSFDDDWWEDLRERNIQVNMKERLLLLHSNFSRLENLKNEVLLATSRLEDSSCRFN